MSLDPQIIMKSLSPKLISKALASFDRAMTVVVGTCWGAALLMMAFAVYTMSLSVSARHAADDAAAAEPNLPQIVHKPIEQRGEQIMVERLQHGFPGITFTLQAQALTVTAVEASKFREWLTALSYIDTISPEYHWTIQQFCVGKCHNNEMMHAVLTGEKISFEAPQP
ncbi:MAG TPA: hypothetical protein VFR09_04230 [Alphaproteobacteria bacterium]|nr:hypothetical protein [Alphaproteobacteria bacterium]